MRVSIEEMSIEGAKKKKKKKENTRKILHRKLQAKKHLPVVHLQRGFGYTEGGGLYREGLCAVGKGIHRGSIH